jgi:hypothetical protein
MDVTSSITFGRLTGAVLICVSTSKQSRQWLYVSCVGGVIGEKSVDADPDDYRARVDPIADAEGDSRPSFDLRIAMKEADVPSSREQAVAAIAKGAISLSGDESFFIRYMPEILELLQALTAEVKPVLLND